MSGECERFNEAQRHHKTHLHRHHLLGIVSESDISFGALFFYFMATCLVSSFFPLNATRVT